MEEKINIAEILKNKSQGTKLYSILSDGECFLNEASEDSIYIDIDNRKRFWCFTVYGSTHSFPNGCVLLFPSKEMRDWAKFAWKKGDVLSCGVDNLCIFEKWANEEYTEFYAKFVTPNYSGNTFKTEKWSKETNEAVIKQYISNIEEFKGGKLNLTTLEIEKQLEFKDGDIVVYGKSVAICRKIYKHTLSFYVSLNEMFGLLFADEVESSEEYRFATEEEKQQLFDALEKEGKAWDVEKKQIVDLSKECEFKPMDWCLMRDIRGEECFAWSLCQFAYQLKRGKYEAVGGMRFDECIPYNEETAHLLGTTDEWKGGEG
jgi:hypothetical protein